MSHFLIESSLLRWIVTVLFGASVVGYAYVLVAHHAQWICTISHLLHLVMAVAMMAMVWPVGMGVATIAPMAFFLAAAVWFSVVACRVSSDLADRVANGYNAVMMTVMVWMYAVMGGSLPGQIEPGWVTTVNWIVSVGFAVALVYWLYRYFVDRKENPVSHTGQPANVAVLGQVFMAAGIAVVFA
jgi:hypothetical protein